MSLKIKLNSKEKMVIGNAVIQNDNNYKIILTVLNKVPILREKDILLTDENSSPLENLYLSIQLLYLGYDSWDNYKIFLKYCDIGNIINNMILNGDYYLALKTLLPYIRGNSNEKSV